MKHAPAVGAGALLLCLTFPFAPGSTTPELAADFDWMWDTLRTQLFDSTLVDRFFTETHRRPLAECARAASSPDELARAVNSLLDSLNLSHNRVFTESDAEYYMFRSMFESRDIATPKVHHLGIQCLPTDPSVLRAVWDGYPAARAGLRRGDVILAADGHPFHPLNSFRAGAPATLTIRRQQDTLDIRVEPVCEGINASLLQAMKNSVKHLSVAEHPVGYVHLWSGTCPEILREFTRLVTEDFRDVDGILLDLRDGWGGAWYDYLDPFFQDRSDFYVATTLRRGRRTISRPDPVGTHAWFRSPLVVLINEGTRSGKEAMAFQFKKSKRAVLVGSTTAGAFTGGSNAFRAGFVLFYPYNGPILLDDQRIEGLGVAPDVRVDDPVERPGSGDPQLERGIEELRSLLVPR